MLAISIVKLMGYPGNVIGDSPWQTISQEVTPAFRAHWS